MHSSRGQVCHSVTADEISNNNILFALVKEMVFWQKLQGVPSGPWTSLALLLPLVGSGQTQYDQEKASLIYVKNIFLLPSWGPLALSQPPWLCAVGETS